MSVDFKSAHHSFIISDLHLADAEPPHPRNPLWKRYKRPKLFIDREFHEFLQFIDRTSPPGAELILNGDIFDFDSVTVLPKTRKNFHISWLERRRGLAAEEPKSRFKMRVILEDHPLWVQALREFVQKGHKVIFVIGNHDMELHWPSVQNEVLDFLEIAAADREQIRFCEWFYVSNQDTLIEHGNQYDAYCVCANPIHPLVRKGFKIYVRLPFGNLAARYMVNGMGLINPHADSNFIMSLSDWVKFFFRYVVRVQPLLGFTWFWTAMVTLFTSVSEGLLPSIKDPLTTEARVESIALKSNSTPNAVRALRELHEHPAIFNPFQILRELWLDRALLFGLIVFASFEIITVLNIFTQISLFWFFLPFALFLPVYLYYFRSVKSDLHALLETLIRNVGLSAQIAHAQRVIHGHTHRETHEWVDGIELLNTGTWSPAFKDPECTQPDGRKCFAWIYPAQEGRPRESKLMEWTAAVVNHDDANENQEARIHEIRIQNPII